MKQKIQQLIRFLKGLSTCCGAEIDEWSSKNVYCSNCARRA